MFASALCPVSTVANVENNKIRLENNDISGHILPALFFILTLVSNLHSRIALFYILIRSRDRREYFKQYKTFASVLQTEENAEKCDTRLGQMENNARRM